MVEALVAFDKDHRLLRCGPTIHQMLAALTANSATVAKTKEIAARLCARGYLAFRDIV
jgi:hypothetical protein